MNKEVSGLVDSMEEKDMAVTILLVLSVVLWF